MSFEINNPLPILSAKFLGVGVEIIYEHYDEGGGAFCVAVEAVMFKWCKKWLLPVS